MQFIQPTFFVGCIQQKMRARRMQHGLIELQLTFPLSR